MVLNTVISTNGISIEKVEELCKISVFIVCLLQLLVWHFFTPPTKLLIMKKKKSQFYLYFSTSLLIKVWGQRIFFLTSSMALCKVIAAEIRYILVWINV